MKLYTRIILVCFAVHGVVSTFAEHCLNFSFLALRQFSVLPSPQILPEPLSHTNITGRFSNHRFVLVFFVNGLEFKKTTTHLVSVLLWQFLPELLTCNDKMVPSLRGSISQTKQEVVSTQRLQKDKAEAIFLSVVRERKED